MRERALAACGAVECALHLSQRPDDDLCLSFLSRCVSLSFFLNAHLNSKAAKKMGEEEDQQQRSSHHNQGRGGGQPSVRFAPTAAICTSTATSPPHLYSPRSNVPMTIKSALKHSVSSTSSSSAASGSTDSGFSLGSFSSADIEGKQQQLTAQLSFTGRHWHLSQSPAI